jgi:hypothetical protein
MSTKPLVPDREWIRKHVISATLVVTLVVSAMFHWASRTVSREAVSLVGGAIITEQAIARDINR